MRHFLVVLALAGCVEAPRSSDIVVPPESYGTPDGKPPAMGTATLEEGGTQKVLTTIDFSIGAFDASAYFQHMEEPAPEFRLSAWPGGDAEATSGILVLEGTFGGKIAPGSAAVAAKVAELIGTDPSGRRWTSEAGGTASLVIDSFAPERPGASSGYGHATGHFAGRICSGDGDPVRPAAERRCREVTGQFETDVQYEP